MNRFTSISATIALLAFAGMASAQTPANVKIVSGNGQLVCSATALCLGATGAFNFETLVVRVTDANGVPVPNATVNWAANGVDFLSSQIGTLRSTTSVTDNSGIAFNNFDLSFAALTGTDTFAFTQVMITASVGSASATFIETEALPPNPTGGQQIPPITFAPVAGAVFPYSGTSLSGQVGTSGAPIQVQVLTTRLSTPVPNVAVLLVNDLPASQASTVRCAEAANAGTDTVLTNAAGVATCTPIFGGVPNKPNTAYLAVGGAYPYEHLVDPTRLPTPFFQIPGGDARMTVNATPATPGLVRQISGNSQTAQAGQAFAAPLVVSVESAASNGVGLAGLNVNWTVAPAGAASLGSTTTTTDVNGRSSNTVRLAAGANGPVQVTATVAGTNLSFTFNLTAVAPTTITGLQIISGNNQSAIVNSAFGAPLIVQLNGSNGAASGIPVQFTITGPGTLSANSATTNSAGQAQVTVQSTGQSGAVTVVASSSGFSQTFNLTVSPPGPTLTALAFMNAADFQRGALSPCSLTTVIAPGLAPGLQGMVTSNFIGPLPFVLANDKLTVGGSAAPVMSVGLNASGREQLTFQVPCDVTPGSSVPVIVSVGGGSATINLPIQAASPGIFQSVQSDGVTRAVMLRPDGSFVSPQNPARRGENLIAFVTGLGVTNPLVPTNGVAPPGAIVAPQGTVVVGLAGAGVPLVSAQLSYDVVGLWLVTFSVPTDVRTGNDISFSISVIPAGSSAPISSAGTIIPVQ